MSVLARVTAHLEWHLFKKFLKWNLSAEFKVFEASTKVADFYCPYLQGNGFEFGWTECPHWRWRTVVAVKLRDYPVGVGAEVTATCPDGREYTDDTDEYGKAVFYLPDGNNGLVVGYAGLRGTGTAAVNGAPSTVILKIKSDQRLFVKLPAACETKYPEINSVICSYYPGAIYYKSGGESSLVAGDGILTIEVGAAYNDYTEKMRLASVTATFEVLRAVESEYGTTINKEYVYSAHVNMDYELGTRPSSGYYGVSNCDSTYSLTPLAYVQGIL